MSTPAVHDAGNRRIRAIRFGAVLAPPNATIQATAIGSTIRATVLDSSGTAAPGVRVDFTAPDAKWLDGNSRPAYTISMEGLTMSTIDRFAAWAPRILGVTRILAGIMFACHGAQLLGAFGGVPPATPAGLVWTAGPIELVGGALITLGLFSRIAAFVSSGTMAFAYFIGHASHGFWPTMNGGELSILYCWLFLYIAAQGPGAWTLDSLLRRPR